MFTLLHSTNINHQHVVSVKHQNLQLNQSQNKLNRHMPE